MPWEGMIIFEPIGFAPKPDCTICMGTSIEVPDIDDVNALLDLNG